MCKIICSWVIIFFLYFTTGWSKISNNKLISDFTNMHKSIYKVFNFHNDDVIYNYLSYIYTDKALDDIYFYFLKQIREMETNHSVNIIKKIKYNKITIMKKSDAEVKIYVKWEVHGIVRHQLHEHFRVNIYKALYTLLYDKLDKKFKIDKTKILESKRVNLGYRYF